MYTLELANIEDANACYQIVDAGRRFQQEQGFTQWTEDYPNIVVIREDILSGKGYVLRADDEIAGYMYIDFSGEPAYAHIDGKWRADRTYAVIHRMAFSEKFRGIGLTDIAFRLVEDLCLKKGVTYIRVDTDFPNKRMQHILTKNGFVNCGIIDYHGSKLAYDKLLV